MKPVGVGRAGRKPQVPRSSAKRQLGIGHGARAGESCQTLAEAAPEPSKGADKRLEQDQERIGRQEMASVGNLSCRDVPSPPASLEEMASSLALFKLLYSRRWGGQTVGGD